MTIIELSKKTGLTSDTIRYYEKIGILPKPKRSPNGYRHYEESMVTKLQMISHAKELGFGISELKELSKLFLSKKLDSKEMSSRLKIKLEEIDRKIESFSLLKKEYHFHIKR